MLLRRLFAGLRSARGEFERGTAAARAGRMAEAVVALRRALEIRPDYPEAQYNLGAAYRDIGEADAALGAYRRAAQLAPRFADVHVDIAALLRERRELAEAERSLQTALALRPDSPEALLELGNVRKGAGDWRAALDAFQRALTLDPAFSRARWALAVAQIPVIEDGSIDRAERREAFARELGALEAWAARDPEAYQAVAEHQPFYLAYLEAPNRELLVRYGSLCASLMQRWQSAAGLAAPQPRGRASRMRVGIVSAHFSDHSVWQALVRGWLTRLDRDRFELHLFHLGRRDAQTERAAALASAFHEGKGRWEHWARFIHASRMDVLLYPEIGMDPATAKLASLRLAPVQAASWGHPETSGLPTMDYYLSAQALEPERAQDNYSEKLVLLPGTGCWLPREDPPARPVEVPKAEVLLVCPGTPFKYAAEHDKLLVEIARRVPGGKLVFFRGKPDALSDRFEQRLRAAFDGAFDRHAVFLPWLDPPAFRALLAAAHLYLDTVGFSGFNTALQAVRCGLPVVTREGRFLRGRLASGLLRHIGLDELVATSDAAYVELAAALATDAARRERLGRRLREAGGRLFEDEAPVRALEEFFERVSGAA